MNSRFLPRRARDALYRAIENIWAIGFAAQGILARPSARVLKFTGGQNVCVIAPHPDDEVMGCGGTLVLHTRAGDAVRVGYATDGRSSRALGLPENEMAKRRRAEAATAAQRLGIAQDWLGLPENAWKTSALENALAQLWRGAMPEILYLPSRVDFHPEHFRVAHACAHALAQLSFKPRVRVYGMQVPLTLHLCNCIAATGSARAPVENAMDAYATQRGSIARGWRMKHYAARLYGVNGLAEEFWEMDTAQYIRLHQAAPETWNARAFRGVRMAPFTDPLAYVFGRAGTRAFETFGGHMRTTRARILFLVVLAVYWTISLYALAIVPRAYEDEAWQASVGAKLAAQGVLGSDLFEGYHEMEQHYFGFMPVFPVMLAALFRFADAGLLQARFVTVSCGLVVLALTYRLGLRLGLPARVGLGAAALLLGVRAIAISLLHPTGILFLDAVRVARYDAAVPLWGLAALHVYLTARANRKLFWYALAGFLCALATLTHLYGAFFLASVLLLVAWDKLPRRGAAIGATLGAFALPLALYALYALAHFDTWRAQTRLYAERFELSNPVWYIENLMREPSRYAIGLDDSVLWLRPGLWLVGIGVMASFVWLAWRARREKNFPARVLITVTGVFVAGYALLLTTKFTNYLIAVLPVMALGLAWGLDEFFRVWTRRQPRLGPVCTILLMGALAAESILQLAELPRAAATTTPFPKLIAAVQAKIPPGARVLGMHHYGLGWEHYAYRSLATPLLLSDPNLEPTPLRFGAALDAQYPEYILIDPHMREVLMHNPQRGAFWDWMQKHNTARVGSVDDATYGLIEIYRVTP